MASEKNGTSPRMQGLDDLSTGAETATDTLHFERLAIDVTITSDGYTKITTQDMHCVNTCDHVTYVAGFGNISAAERVLKLAQELQDIVSVLPK
ncbi:uncharacterized protein H6S33_011938 [Morchella sextelata]|uniref:uncharacterized protein n=1 Tax=Morchella sextelata TaxID=1174677 RepID=UPI001D04E787|nr:uncharacterized protein H6S33_011938 [Morchella sextelata]KAH0610411.1 hypothetical protein H6S33_011938 [Morchella sextelata]